jgi:hypothetical protein
VVLDELFVVKAVAIDGLITQYNGKLQETYFTTSTIATGKVTT